MYIYTYIYIYVYVYIYMFPFSYIHRSIATRNDGKDVVRWMEGSNGACKRVGRGRRGCERKGGVGGNGVWREGENMYIYVYIYAYIYIYMYVNMYMYKYVYIYMCMFEYEYVKMHNIHIPHAT